MAKATMLLLLFVAMDGSLLGQSYFRDVARLGGTYAEDSASGDSACGTIEVAPGPLGGASMFGWNYVDLLGASVYHQFAMPFNRPGGCARVAQGQYLVSGATYDPVTDTYSGRYCKVLLTRVGSSLSHAVQEIVQLPDIDPVGTAWSSLDGLVYILDYRQQRILAAPWGGWLFPLPAQASFVLVGDRSSDPNALRSFALLGFSANEEEIERGMPDNSLTVWPKPWWKGCQVYRGETSETWQFQPDGMGGWLRQYTSADYWANPAPNRLQLDPSVFVGSGSEFIVKLVGEGSRNFEIVDGWDESVVISGVTSAAGLSVTPPAVFLSDPGRPYMVRDASSSGVRASSTFFFSAVRYGQPLAAQDLVLSRGLMPMFGPDVGTAQVGFPWGVGTMVDAVTGSGPCFGALWVGLRGSDGSDPITWQGTTAVLNPVASVTFVSNLSALRADISHAMTFFDGDPSWDGQVVLFQYAVLTPLGVAASDVFGRKIRDINGSGQASAMSSPSMSSPVVAARAQQLRMRYPVNGVSVMVRRSLMGF